MGDAAPFIAPVLLVAYVAAGGLLLLLSDVRKQRRSRRQTLQAADGRTMIEVAREHEEEEGAVTM